jgi:hypothetical protein
MKYKALSLCPSLSTDAPDQEHENENELTVGETVITNSDNSNDNWVDENEEKINFIMYPNPGHGIIQFRIYKGQSEYYNVMIRNSIGQLVYEAKLKERDQMDLELLAPGIYYVNASDLEGRSITQMLIIK